MGLIKPLLQDSALLDDIHQAETSKLHLWWLGQSGFLVKTGSGHLLIDPYLSDSLTRKYASTDKPHVRMTECPVNPAALNFIDVVTSSHNHTDHLDHDTLVPLRAVNPGLRMAIPEANREFVANRLDCPLDWPTGLWEGHSTKLAGYTITALASAHESLETDGQGHHLCLGYLFSNDRWTIFHPGDAIPYEGLEEKVLSAAGERRINVALMPINGRLPERRVTGNFWGREAAQFAKAIRAEIVVPMHYEMFEFNTETPDEFVDECKSLGQAYRVLRCGERLTLD